MLTGRKSREKKREKERGMRQKLNRSEKTKCDEKKFMKSVNSGGKK